MCWYRLSYSFLLNNSCLMLEHCSWLSRSLKQSFDSIENGSVLDYPPDPLYFHCILHQLCAIWCSFLTRNHSKLRENNSIDIIRLFHHIKWYYSNNVEMGIGKSPPGFRAHSHKLNTATMHRIRPFSDTSLEMKHSQMRIHLIL